MTVVLIGKRMGLPSVGATKLNGAEGELFQVLGKLTACALEGSGLA
jgi:hypothetical protein